MKMRRIVLGILFTFMFAMSSAGTALSQQFPTPATVRVGFFSNSLPLIAAEKQGYFADENLTISTLQVRSSVQMFQLIRDNLMDIGFSSPDNPVNYRLNTNNAVGQALDVTMLFGTDLGLNLSLVAQPEYTTVESLRGKRIGVDAPDSGFAYVLYKIMRQHGLEPGRDYTVVIFGGTPIRLRELLLKHIDATLLNADSVVRAADAGKLLLAPATDIANPYLGGVASARETWLAANPDIAVRFIRAYYRGHVWSMDPANRDAAIQLLISSTTPQPLAEKIYDMLQSPTGLIENARLDRKGLLNVIRLRDEFGGFENEQNLKWLDTPASGLFDLSYYRRATNSAIADDVIGLESNPLYLKDYPEAHDPGGNHELHGHDADGDVIE